MDEAAGDRSGSFRRSVGTYIVLIFLLIVFPALNIVVAIIAGTDIDFGRLNLIAFFFVPTIIMHLLMTLAIFLALWREKASIASIGLNRITWSHLGYAVVFLIASNPILIILEFILTGMGAPFTNATPEILRQAEGYFWWWLSLSVSAAFCEEIPFRGYVLSRLKGMTRWGWTIPVLLGNISFASGHLYQGWGGFILIFAYGAMFSFLYIRSGSLWPAILAHFIQNFSALFLYKYFAM